MKKQFPRRLLLLSLSALLSACAPDPKKNPPPPGNDLPALRLLEVGKQLYAKGDYEQARECFEGVAGKAAIQNDARRWLEKIDLSCAEEPLEEGKIVTRSYPVDPILFANRIPIGGTSGGGFGGDSDLEEAKQEDSIEKIFRRYGTELSEDLSVDYDSLNAQLQVTGSLSDHRIINELLNAFDIFPHQIEIDCSYIAFKVSDIEAEPEWRETGTVGQETIKALQREGKGKLRQALKVVTINNVNAIAEGVEEIIYPTEYDVTETSASNQLQTVLPGAFETREIGGIFNVTPTVSPDNESIYLTLLPEYAQYLDKINYGTAKQAMEQPVFGSQNITTSIVIKDGATLVLGGMREPDEDWITYTFIRARLLDSSGKPIR